MVGFRLDFTSSSVVSGRLVLKIPKSWTPARKPQTRTSSLHHLPKQHPKDSKAAKPLPFILLPQVPFLQPCLELQSSDSLHQSTRAKSEILTNSSNNHHEKASIPTRGFHPALRRNAASCRFIPSRSSLGLRTNTCERMKNRHIQRRKSRRAHGQLSSSKLP